MRTQKRKKSSVTTPDQLAQRLISAWLSDGEQGPFEDDVFNEIMRMKDPDEILARAAMRLPQEDRFDFSLDLYEIAGSDYCRLIMGENKRHFEAGLHLFTFLTYGPEDEIEKFSSGQTFNAVTKMFRACGFAHEQSNVAICAIPIDPIAASNAEPSIVRGLLNSLSKAAVNGEIDDLNRKVRSLLRATSSEKKKETPQTKSIVTRLFVGARLLPFVSPNTRDLFAPPVGVSTNIEVNEKVFIAHEEKIAEATAQFLDSAHSTLESENLHLTVDGPFDWTTGIGMMAFHHILGSVMLQAALHQIDGRSQADEMHFAETEDELHVALRWGSAVIGPISYPMEIAQYAMDEITDWLSEAAKKTVLHKTLAAFKNATQSSNLRLH